MSRVVGNVWCVVSKSGEGLFGVFSSEALAEDHIGSLSTPEDFEVEWAEVHASPIFEEA